MIRTLCLSILASLLLLLSGCGGSSALGKNSNIVIHLQRTDGTQIMTQYEIFLTKDGATSFSLGDGESFASTINKPTWCDNYTNSRTNTELKLAFTTRSDQTPYFMWVKVPNTGSAFETLKLQIDIDGVAGSQQTYDLNINQTQRLFPVEIDRNSASY